MLTLGIDPDSTDTAFAWWDERGPVAAAVAHVVRHKGESPVMQMAYRIKHMSSRSEVARVAIEGQQFDSRKTTIKSILTLCRVSGVCVAYAADRHMSAELLIPTPFEWKGGVSKHAHQGRLYQELGWGYHIVGSGKGRYARPLAPPTNFNHIKPGQWKHVGDALLLARWAQPK